MTKINLYHITQNTKDRATRTPPKTKGELSCSGSVNSSCSTFGTHRVTIVTNPETSHEFKREPDCNYDKQKKNTNPVKIENPKKLKRLTVNISIIPIMTV